MGSAVPLTTVASSICNSMWQPVSCFTNKDWHMAVVKLKVKGTFVFILPTQLRV